MKERNLYDEEFEKQLKEKADQFKMYPSDKVWNEVYSSVHTGRRKFVAGMTLLIGGILILAGTQLLSPARNATTKNLASKISVTAKPGTASNLHSLAPNSFALSPSDNSDDQALSEASLNSGLDFDLHSGPSSVQESDKSEILKSKTDEIQINSRIKPIQQTDMNVSAKGASSIALTDLNQSFNSIPAKPMNNLVSEDIVTDKSAAQLNYSHNDKLRWQIYAAPTYNTHYLTGSNYQTIARSIQTVPVMVVHVANVNGFVDNTPTMGYDVGGNLLYRISKNISLKAGLDFSFNRYYIKAYNSNPTQASATLSSYQGYIPDSLLNSNSGMSTDKNPQHYQNKYYQLSLPIGVEMNVAGNGKLQLHVGATLQPSYLLNTDAYVLSNDYSSYIKDPSALRRWNLIAGTEVYLSYAVGKVRWEIGPQVRYQIFSTYKNSYPLQENMLNYGIRIGISKSIR